MREGDYISDYNFDYNSCSRFLLVGFSSCSTFDFIVRVSCQNLIMCKIGGKF